MLWFCAGSVFGDDVASLASRSADFEAAVASGDAEAAGRLTLPEARWITEQGSQSGLIVEDIEAGSGWSAKGPADNLQYDVVERLVDVHGDGATVVELVTVTSKVALKPVRRSMFWVRDDDGWKLAHIHVSPYLRWDKEISAFEAADAKDPPKKGGVVFIGSSSIRRWDTLANDFANMPVVNRGFGGSEMVDSVLFAKRVVTPRTPTAVVIYAGDNDIGKGKNGDRVFADFRQFVASVHAESPESMIGFIAIKPSLKRWARWTEIKRANELIQAFAASHPKVVFLDIATPMLGADGTPRKELFVKDGLHLNMQGYAVWTNVIKPWVSSVLADDGRVAN